MNETKMMMKYSSRTRCGRKKLTDVLLKLQAGCLPTHILKVCLGIKPQAPDGFHQARHLQPVNAEESRTAAQWSVECLQGVCCNISGMPAA